MARGLAGGDVAVNLRWLERAHRLVPTDPNVTLALASAMAGKGMLIAADTIRSRLSRLDPRAERAGATFIETLLLDQGHEAGALESLHGRADVVLVDAPCSGTGTWRRNPEARWRLTPARLDRLVAEQARILDFAAPLLAP